MLDQECSTTAVENQAHTSGTCPKCGYGDKCGRQNFQPYPYWPAPYYPYIWYNVPQTGYTTTTFPETGTYVWTGNVMADTIPSVQI